MRRPTAWPRGVVVPYARAMSQGLGDVGEKEVIAAMRAPRAMPSKVSVVGCQAMLNFWGGKVKGGWAYGGN